jgi:hypothetical protein
MKKTMSALFIWIVVIAVNPLQAQKEQITIERVPFSCKISKFISNGPGGTNIVILRKESDFVLFESIVQDKHLEKSRLQKKVGKILLGAGAGLFVIGAVIPRGDHIADHYPERHYYDRLKSVLMKVGVITSVASIPFFIVSKQNRKRSASIGIGVEKTRRLAGENLSFIHIPALTFKAVF